VSKPWDAPRGVCSRSLTVSQRATSRRRDTPCHRRRTTNLGVLPRDLPRRSIARFRPGLPPQKIPGAHSPRGHGARRTAEQEEWTRVALGKAPTPPRVTLGADDPAAAPAGSADSAGRVAIPAGDLRDVPAARTGWPGSPARCRSQSAAGARTSLVVPRQPSSVRASPASSSSASRLQRALEAQARTALRRIAGSESWLFNTAFRGSRPVPKKCGGWDALFSTGFCGSGTPISPPCRYRWATASLGSRSLCRNAPFGWWVAVAVDHFSRRVLGAAVFRSEPAAGDVTRALSRVHAAVRRCPAHLITDHFIGDGSPRGVVTIRKPGAVGLHRCLLRHSVESVHKNPWG
jgi:hypothetical protein